MTRSSVPRSCLRTVNASATNTWRPPKRRAVTRRTANRTKDQFLAMLGHELRNPLSPIVTALQLLKTRGGTGQEHAVIERQVNHLTRLVDDLLDVSRITRGKVEMQQRPIEIHDVVTRPGRWRAAVRATARTG